MGFLPIFYLPGRFPGIHVCWSRCGLCLQQPAGVGGTSHREEEAQALLQVPDPRAGEGVPLQRIRVQAEALGARQKPEPDGEASEDMVPEQTDEEQEELPKTSSPGAEQQQQFRSQQSQSPFGASPRALAAPRVEPPCGQWDGGQAPSVTNALLWGLPASLQPSWNCQLSAG